jgi:preprotein translocase subunit SecG
MSLLSILLLVIFVIAALIMMLVILVQDDQGEGIGGIFGGGSTTPFGSRSGNILTRFTAIMAAVFIMGAFSLAWVNRTPESADIVEKARMERLKTAQDKNWWVERIETPAPQAEAAPSPCIFGPTTSRCAGCTRRIRDAAAGGLRFGGHQPLSGGESSGVGSCSEPPLR